MNLVFCTTCLDYHDEGACPESMTVLEAEIVSAGSDSRPAPGWPALRWSAEKPAADGWWWWQAHPNYPKKAVEIWSKTRGSKVLERLCNYCGQTNLDALTKTYPAGRWAGPLPEPVEASDAETTHRMKICETLKLSRAWTRAYERMPRL